MKWFSGPAQTVSEIERRVAERKAKYDQKLRDFEERETEAAVMDRRRRLGGYSPLPYGDKRDKPNFPPRGPAGFVTPTTKQGLEAVSKMDLTTL